VKKTAKRPSERRVRSKGRRAWVVEWDSGGPGAGAGCEAIYELDGLYWYPCEWAGLMGPYKTLAEPVAETDINLVNGWRGNQRTASRSC
jgi:hypothetical protein